MGHCLRGTALRSTACSISADPDSAVSPGTPITVSTKLRRNQAPVAFATLLARVNYAPEQELPMTAGGDAGGWSGWTGRQAAHCVWSIKGGFSAALKLAVHVSVHCHWKALQL